MPVFDKFFANATALPSMPEVAHRLLRAFDDENLSLQALADRVSQDQGLSVKLLRMSNSARYSPRHTISTVKDAAATIGLPSLPSLSELALAACVAGAFPKGGSFDRLRFWRQCLATAGHARVLAQVCDLDLDLDLDLDTAFLAGLMWKSSMIRGDAPHHES